MDDTRPVTVDEYITAQTPAFQPTLRELRAIIRNEAPDAEERIAYGVPAYRRHYGLVSFGVTKNTCSFYTQSPGLVEHMQDELRHVKVSGATLHFPPGEPLPEELLRQIIRTRIQEDDTRAAART